MLNLLKISEGANIAVHALAYLSARKDEDLHSVSEIAKNLNISEAHLAKVFQRLVKHRFIESSRGAKGGFILKSNPDKLSVFQIVEAVDGPFYKDSCLLGKPICDADDCVLRDLSDTVSAKLKNIKLSKFSKGIKRRLT